MCTYKSSPFLHSNVFAEEACACKFVPFPPSSLSVSKLFFNVTAEHIFKRFVPLKMSPPSIVALGIFCWPFSALFSSQIDWVKLQRANSSQQNSFTSIFSYMFWFDLLFFVLISLIQLIFSLFNFLQHYHFTSTWKIIIFYFKLLKKSAPKGWKTNKIGKKDLKTIGKNNLN